MTSLVKRMSSYTVLAVGLAASDAEASVPRKRTVVRIQHFERPDPTYPLQFVLPNKMTLKALCPCDSAPPAGCCENDSYDTPVEE